VNSNLRLGSVKGVFGIAPRNSRSENSTPLQIFSAKHTHTADLLQKKGGVDPSSMVFVEYLRGCSTNSKSYGVGRNYPPLPLVSGKNGSVLFFSSRLSSQLASPDAGPAVSICLCYSTLSHNAYTVRVYDHMHLPLPAAPSTRATGQKSLA
jgi:hypothetical protein